MNSIQLASRCARLLLLAILLCAAGFAGAGQTDIATAPLATSPAVSVQPNVLFVLDDSASMDNDSLPDWANDQYCRKTDGTYTAPCCRDDVGLDGTTRNGPCWRDTVTPTEVWPFASWRGAPPYLASDFNSLYYNPAITYAPPVNGDGTRKPNQSDPANVPTDAYGLQNAAAINLTTQFPDAEWCAAGVTPCLTNGNYILPGVVNGKNYNIYRAAYATGSRSVVSGTPAAPVVQTRALGPHYYTILPGDFCDNINLRNCQATRTAVYAIPAPVRWCSSAAAAAATSPALGTCQAVKTPTYNIPRYPTRFTGSGAFMRTDIVPGTASYPYPGTSAKAASRTDCAGSTCSYKEEITNFANWWAYYHTRMQTAKSAASIAFANLDTRYRVGYFTINKSTDATNAINIASFDATQKSALYGKLFAAYPNATTPLPEALARAGRIYAGKLGGTVGGKDPMQYSCQQNFTIMMTDGEWSTNRPGKKIDGTTLVGDQDGTAARPKFDGNATPDTLADVAAYYYNTDLRASSLMNCTGTPVAPATAGNDVCLDNVPPGANDHATNQRMATFTVGFGITGYMQFTPDYAKAASGDFYSVKVGASANPAGGVCSWQASGKCNWAAPTTTAGRLDDVWHAAVNGDGSYYSANDPAAVAIGLSNALSGMGAKIGSGATATASNPNLVAGDNYLFSSTYMPTGWWGDLVRQAIDPITGAVSSTRDWSAKKVFETNTVRTIYTFDASTQPTANGSAIRRKSFSWNSLTNKEQNYFKKSTISSLTQFCNSGATCLSSADQNTAADDTLLAFLAGDRSHEGVASDTSKFYRLRTSVLGDIVGSQAVYVKAPLYTYADSGYTAFKKAKSDSPAVGNTPAVIGRQGIVYVAANDGMLHAFNADSGVEEWAYVPSLVLPEMYKLADKNYDALHTFQLDGSPNQGDVYDGNAWHTILVGGMNRGGRGYYALDVTDPATPKALWEFTSDTSKGANYTADANLGYTFGKPEITKLTNGTWVVLVTSGLNNVSPGNGKGYLYVLNAMTGALIRKIPTGVGSTATPSGLAQIRAWADSTMFNNTAQRVYGGDMLGNFWRFDINDNVGPAGYDAFLLATMRDAAGNPQPMTARPEIGNVNGIPMVYVGTGRYLGLTDVSDLGVQTIYALKDKLTAATGYGNPRGAAGFVRQVLTRGTCPANSTAATCSPGQPVMTGTSNAVDLLTDNGWYVDLPAAGERANTDPQLALGTLSFTTNVPDATPCTAGGYSNVYFFDYRNGAAVTSSSNGVVGNLLGNSLATGGVMAKTANGTIIDMVRLMNGELASPAVPIGPTPHKTRRLNWRVLQNEN